ncbi:thiamine monophosphate synthase [Rhizobium leguminosarum]|nr:thiamine monophosphate synthase [Rhizobium leguminosarum]
MAADGNAIRRAGPKLGLSMHDISELETAVAAEPDCVRSDRSGRRFSNR